MSVMITLDVASKLSDAELRQKLREHGSQPGPITATTRNVYEKLLVKLCKAPIAGPKVKSKVKLEMNSSQWGMLNAHEWIQKSTKIANF